MHNADLCDTLGNLVHRGTNLCKKYCGGIIPDVPAPPSPPMDFVKVRDSYQAKMDNFELEGGAAIAMQAFRDVNGYLTEEAPWLKKGDEFEEERKIVVRATLEAIYALSHLLLPFIPAGATKIFQKLNTSPKSIADISTDLRNLETGAKVEIGDVLFKKVCFHAPVSTYLSSYSIGFQYKSHHILNLLSTSFLVICTGYPSIHVSLDHVGRGA